MDQATLSELALPLVRKQLKLTSEMTEAPPSQCIDDDRVQDAVGSTCAQLSLLGACEVYFCKECKYTGLCDVSCDLCPSNTTSTTTDGEVNDVPLVFMGRGNGALLGAGFASWVAPFK